MSVPTCPCEEPASTPAQLRARLMRRFGPGKSSRGLATLLAAKAFEWRLDFERQADWFEVDDPRGGQSLAADDPFRARPLEWAIAAARQAEKIHPGAGLLAAAEVLSQTPPDIRRETLAATEALLIAAASHEPPAPSRPKRRI